MAGPLGSAPAIIVGTGVGAAAALALTPAFELPRQAAWERNPNRILDPGLMARLVAQGGVALGVAHEDAKRDGYAADKLDALVYLAQTVPDVAQALDLWRRDLISDQLWTHVLVKHGLDARYYGGLNKLKDAALLSPADLAYAVVRGLVPDEGILPVAPPAAGVKLKRFPVFPINPLEEAAKWGWNRDRFSVLVGRSGLAMAPVMAAQAYFRDIIELPDYYLAIAEGDVRNEYRDAILDVSRQILTSNQYAELQLRGFLTAPQRRTSTAKHGMSNADSDLLFDLLGRSIPVHQVTTGFARGGSFGGTGAGIPPAFLQSLQRGNLRPEYYDLAYANRYSYPSAFFLRRLLEDGVLSQADGEQAFLEVGWSPKYAKLISESLAGGSGTAADPHVTKARTQLWTATHRSFINAESTDDDARDRFGLLEIPAAAQTEILNLWQSERSLIRRQLSPAQIRKAFVGAVTNPSTGNPWTEEEALSALLARGYDAPDAVTFLAEA